MILLDYRGILVGNYKVNPAQDNQTKDGRPWTTVRLGDTLYRLKEETTDVYVEDSGPLVIPE